MQTASPRPRRSVLYLPASNRRAIDKARTLAADAIVFDLEDAVAPASKAQARQNLVEAFAAGRFGNRETVIRVNSIGSSDWIADLQTVAACRPDAILLPKIGHPDDLRRFQRDAQAAGLGPLRGVQAGRTVGGSGQADGPGPLAVWAMIETVAALTAIDQIVAPHDDLDLSLDCLVVGTNDIAKETGVSPANQRQYLLAWLMGIVLAAKHRKITVLDGVWNDFRDTEGFEAEVNQSLAMGFDGKTLIHPTQIEPTNQVFSPSAQAIAEAHDIVAAFALPEHANAGVINLDGRMVERLHLDQAERLLAIADAIASLQPTSNQSDP